MPWASAWLTPQMVLASACLPRLFLAVHIGDEAYWDGGYAGNPSLLRELVDLVPQAAAAESVPAGLDG